VVLGDSLEVFQIAQSTRTYLDEVGRYNTKIMVMTTEGSEIRKTLGKGMENWLKV